MNTYTLTLYARGSSVPTKWLYSSLEEAIEMTSHWEQSKNSSEFNWKISFNGEVIREMIHNPAKLPEDLFV
jgi:hypothetical protein